MATHLEIENETYRRIAVWARERDTVSLEDVQRAFRLSYSGATMFMQRMQQEGILGPAEPSGEPLVVLK